MARVVKSFRKIARQEIYPQNAVGFVTAVSSDRRTVSVELKSGNIITIPMPSNATIYTGYTVDLVRTAKSGRWTITGRSAHVWIPSTVVRG